MQSLFIWTACGLAGLFFAGCVVAWWEHLGRERRHQDEPDWESPVPKRVSVDVELDAWADDLPGDQGERRQALGGALTRMASASPQRWIDTAPMILPGAAAPQTAAAPEVKDKLERRRSRDRTETE